MTRTAALRATAPRAPVRPQPASARLAAAPHAPWGWAAAGAGVGLLAALALFAPAQWLAQGVARASAGRVLLLQARGTVWTGSAQFALSGGPASRDRAALPGRVHWRLRPGLRGVQLQLQADCCTAAPLQVQLRPRWGGAAVRVQDQQSDWPAAVLAGLGAPWNSLQPQGRLVLRTQGLQAAWAAGRLVLQGQAQLDLLDFSSRLATLRPLGSYRLLLQGGEVPTLQLSTLDGALRLQGTGQWVGQRLRFSGEASAAPERAAALDNLLNILGRRDGARALLSLG